MNNYGRVSARRGQPVALDVAFFSGGIPTDPYAIDRIEIYRESVETSNLVETIEVVPPDSSDYPYPLERPPVQEVQTPQMMPPDYSGDTGTGTSIDGRYRLVWDVPADAVVPAVYFDVWYFWGTDPVVGTGDLDDYTDQLLSQCNRFWVYPDNWYADGGLQTIRFGFEPLDIKFRKPERRPLEVGIMPLPLYDYDYNFVAPIIPYINATISMWTAAGEQILTNAPCDLKLRQGSYRTNPWVVSYMLDTSALFKGTYKYRIVLELPDGTTRVSGDYYFTVS